MGQELHTYTFCSPSADITDQLPVARGSSPRSVGSEKRGPVRPPVGWLGAQGFASSAFYRGLGLQLPELPF